MCSQIFRNIIPADRLFKFLELNCTKMTNHFVYNVESYKRGVFNNSINEFLEECKPYYFASKQKYIERKLNYNNFTTIIRQICKSNGITYSSEIKYDKSSYTIVYYIYFNQNIV